VKANWYKYDESGASPTTACESGAYYYFYDALGNVNGVLEEKNGLYHYYKWEMDAFGNDLTGGNDFLAMDQSGPKEHLTGKMYDTVTGLYYFHARWYDPEAGRFVGKDISKESPNRYTLCYNSPLDFYDPDGAAPVKVPGYSIPDYVDLLNIPKSLTGPDDSTCCDRSDLVELRDYLNFYRNVVLFYEGTREKFPKPPSGGSGEAAASTECKGGATEGKATIEFKSPWNKDCFDRCVLEHELVHAGQCHQLGEVGYRALVGRDMELNAYKKSVSCLENEIRKLGGKP